MSAQEAFVPKKDKLTITILCMAYTEHSVLL
jgi:hypothetical protein